MGRIAGGKRFLRKFSCALISLGLISATGCHAQNWPLWNQYSTHFVDAQGRVVDHNAGDRSTSESESYAMFFALVANDRIRFDKLLSWTENNLAQGDLTQHLPAWSWGKAPDGSWRVLDENSASDADLWMAYSLCEAGRLWGVDRYSKLGITIANRIAREELTLIPNLGTTLLPGRQGFHPSPSVWFVNPSYMAPFQLQYFARQDPSAPWAQVLASLPSVLHTSGGFAMDWMQVSSDHGLEPSAPPGVVAALAQGQQPPVPVGSYDAIRVYLWAGLSNSQTPHIAEIRKSIPGMATYLASGHITPPQQVGPEGQVIQDAAPPGFSAAVIPYLHALNRKEEEKSQAARLEATLDPQRGLYGQQGMYYDQNLALFEDGFMSGLYSFERDGRLKVRWK
ncbi:MAG: cellulose synthase complex periplasmic endoglucanase BcsZ [Acidobacteriaceae bacterium]|nr:cellulose synthase complex periplasmic endoglucanase BcsZ [Acidobacteriaceae bacterium]